MSSLLVDASVWLAALDQDDRYCLAAKALVEPVKEDATTGDAVQDEHVQLAALDLTLYEVANVAVVRWHSPTDADCLVELVHLACSLNIYRVDRGLMREAAKIAAEHGLTVYDAAYVASARKHDRTLVSCDLKHLVKPGFAVAPDAIPSRPRPPAERPRRERPLR